MEYKIIEDHSIENNSIFYPSFLRQEATHFLITLRYDLLTGLQYFIYQL